MIILESNFCKPYSKDENFTIKFIYDSTKNKLETIKPQEEHKDGIRRNLKRKPKNLPKIINGRLKKGIERLIPISLIFKNNGNGLEIEGLTIAYSGIDNSYVNLNREKIYLERAKDCMLEIIAKGYISKTSNFKTSINQRYA